MLQVMQHFIWISLLVNIKNFDHKIRLRFCLHCHPYIILREKWSDFHLRHSYGLQEYLASRNGKVNG